MPTTLADLTLRLSQEMSSLDALCAKEIAAAERERDQALASAGPAQDVLSRYHRALEKAKQAQLSSVSAADEGRDREIQAAEDERRVKLAREEDASREARQKALSKKNEASRKATSKWEQALETFREEPLSEQRRLREKADDALEQALEEARESYEREIEEARLAHQSAIQDHLVEERLAVEAARRKAERLITAAAIDHERAVATEETRMRSELAAYPDARAAQEAYDRRVAEIRQSSEQAKEALFKRFSQERRGVRR